MIPLYIMALIGFTSRKLRILHSQANGVITQLMLYITLPALIFYSLNTSFSKDVLIDFTWLVTMSIFILTISIFVAKWLGRKSALPLKQKNVYESLIIFGNQGFIGFAISFILMKEQGIIYLTLFNICYLILIWTYGIYLFTKNEQSVNLKILIFNHCILSTFIELEFLYLLYMWISPLLDTFESVGKMTIPLSMILIGSLLADIQWHELRTYSRNIYIWIRSEEHTSELQSRGHLVCRLLLEKKKN